MKDYESNENINMSANKTSIVESEKSMQPLEINYFPLRAKSKNSSNNRYIKLLLIAYILILICFCLIVFQITAKSNNSSNVLTHYSDELTTLSISLDKIIFDLDSTSNET